MAMTRPEITQRYRQKRYREIDEMTKIACACGCGEMIAPINKLLKPATFAHGHNDGGAQTQFREGQNVGPLNVNWRGGKRKYHSGYVLVLVGKGHPMAKAGRSYAAEHRLVMSEAIGRPLRSGEQVHHINGDRSDNRIENLQLLQRYHAPGVAYRCCECGSHNVEPIHIQQEG